MNKAKDAINGFWTRARGLVRRRRKGGGDGREERPKSRGDGFLRRLIPLACALAASAFVFASLTQCEYGTWAYAFPPLDPSWCARSSKTFVFMSTSGGVGFLIFLIMEVAAMIFAQIWKDRQIDRAERREEAAERRAEAAERRAELAEQTRREDAERAERMFDAAERRAELAEQARREDAERAERRAELAEQARREDAERAEVRAEAAERRELVMLELIASLKNGRDDANGKDDASE